MENINKLHTYEVDISVIMLVYGHERYLRKSLDSVLAQVTDYSYEILVGEDCSPDGCRDILKEYEANYPRLFRMYYRDKNIGATKNAYELYMDARGKYIAPLEADDYWIDTEKLQYEVDFLQEHTEYFGVASNFCKINEEGEIIEESCVDLSNTNKRFKWKNFLKEGFIFQSATIVYRNFYQDGGDYTVFYKAHDMVGDLTGLTIMLNRGDFYILPRITSAYRYIAKKDGTSATSIAKKDHALSILKTIRQCTYLTPYMNNPKDLNPKISAFKLHFLSRVIVRSPGYTWSRWLEVRKMGDSTTNFGMILIAIQRCLEKFLYIMKRIYIKIIGRNKQNE